MRRTLGKLGVGLQDKKGVIGLAERVYDAMKGDPKTYPAPDPPLPTLLLAHDDADGAQKAIGKKKDVALTDARDAKVEVLYDVLVKELVYVQGLANLASSTTAATAVLTGAGYEVITPGQQHPKLLTLQNIAPVGTIRCIVSLILLLGVKTSKKVTLNWQYSMDNGASWIDGKSTPLRETEIPNLPLLKPVLVRASATISKVTGPWCTPESIVVH